MHHTEEGNVFIIQRLQR